jgi:hypothetical protein
MRAAASASGRESGATFSPWIAYWTVKLANVHKIANVANVQVNALLG